MTLSLPAPYTWLTAAWIASAAGIAARLESPQASDGYTALELQYILDSSIIIAVKLNDVTLPASRGFPFQVVAEGKFGYKWAKWVDRIELSREDFLGYWEKEGLNNNADINGPALG